MGKAGKQSERKVQKAPAKEDEAAPASGALLETAKSLALGSLLARQAPKLPALIKEEPSTEPAKPKEEAEDKPEEDNTEDNAEAKEAAPASEEGGAAVFTALKEVLVWHNSLGLVRGSEESKSAWLAMKGQELDFGPRAKRNGSPGVERISSNLSGNMGQYVHVLLALMLVRSFLFRSFFACLPWLCFYQFLSVFLPLDTMEQFGQKIPFEKVPVNFRAAGTIGIHGLVWFFFLFELVWKTNFLEKFFLIGLVVYHSYAVRPVEAKKA